MFSGLLSLLLAFSLIPGCGVCSAEAEEKFAIQADSTDELFLSMTEAASKSLSFPLTEEQAAQVEKSGADQVTSEMGQQRDEYAFISNALFAAFLTETPYVTAGTSGN